VTAPGSQDPTTAYLFHRGALIGIVIILLFATSYLAVQLLPGITEWVGSAIEGLHDEWSSWW
jgi:hypothetical protein